MSEGKLKTAVLGLNEAGQLLLEAVSRVDYFQIEAVADKDTNLAERIAAEYQCTAYDDYRQLITTMDSRLRGDNRCLLIAAGIHSCDEYVRMAMKKKVQYTQISSGGEGF